MRKYLVIIVFSLVWTDISYASCTEDIDFDWRFGNSSKSFILLRYKSKNDKPIIITKATVYTKDKKTIKQINQDYLLEPFRKSKRTLGELEDHNDTNESVRFIRLRGYNTDVIASVGYSCVYK